MRYTYTANPKCRPQGTSPFKSTITFRLHDILKGAFRECCEANRLSMSEAIILALLNWDPLKKFIHKEGNEMEEEKR